MAHHNAQVLDSRIAANAELPTDAFPLGTEQVKRMTWLAILLGGTLMAMGLITLAASLRIGAETRITGMLLVSFGALAISVPLYLDARRMQARQKRDISQKRKRGLVPCAMCGTETATFWCTTHTVRLCADCVPEHHDAARCLYKPLLRAAAAAKR